MFRLLSAGILFLEMACTGRVVQYSDTYSVPGDTSFQNPLLPNGPDPWVIQKDSIYYYSNTLGNRVALYATRQMSALGSATAVNIWTPLIPGPYSREILAPEIHYLNGKWYTYFSADDGNSSNHRIYVIECHGDNPQTGAWSFKGKIADTANDKWAIDPTVFEYDNQLYMAWSGRAGDLNMEQDIFISKMKDPVTLAGNRVMISSPTYEWEKQIFPPDVNDAPRAIQNRDKQLFLTFSASGRQTDSYALGLLTLKKNGNPLYPSDWTKSPQPVFYTVRDHGAFAPGHTAFFKSLDGKEDWMIYHANTEAGQGLGDTRNPRIQRFNWNADGSPNFGMPVSINIPIRKPGGE